VLTSLQKHWSGLVVFLDHPEVPLDNYAAERAERGPVVARKNY
jgi:transposase